MALNLNIKYLFHVSCNFKGLFVKWFLMTELLSRRLVRRVVNKNFDHFVSAHSLVIIFISTFIVIIFSYFLIFIYIHFLIMLSLELV